MREGLGFSHFPKTPECDSHKIQGVTVEYIPERGFTGSDDFELDVIYQVGTEALATYDITIKPWDFSDTLSTDDFLKEKEWARGDSLRMRNDDTHAVSTKQTQWPAVDEFLALRAAPSSNFRIQDDLPFEAAPTSRELPDTEAQGQVAEIVTPPMRFVRGDDVAHLEREPSQFADRAEPTWLVRGDDSSPEYAPMQPGVAPQPC